MNRRMIARTATIVAIVTLAGADALGEENFHRLMGPQIQTKFTGIEMTDGVHWGDVYSRNGTLTTYSMGHKIIGKWSVQKDELCVDRGKEFKGWYQVWISGKKVELRREDAKLPLEGELRPPAKRN